MNTVTADVRPAKINGAPTDASMRHARSTMGAWRDYRGSNPLAGAGADKPEDRCDEFLSNAGAMLSMLSAACEDAQSLLDKGENSEFDNRKCTILAGALDGVGDLINLAAFLMEDE